MPEQTSPEQLKMEREAEKLERKIVRFTNIDNEKFTHAFRGISISVLPGKSQIMRLPEADHLATHLARKILSREKKAVTKKDKGVQLWNDKSVGELKAKILTAVDTEDAPDRLSPEDARKQDQKQLDDKYGDRQQFAETTPEPKPETPEPKPETPAGIETEVSKADVIKDLESRGIKVDASKSKDELLEQLIQAEADGVEVKE